MDDEYSSSSSEETGDEFKPYKKSKQESSCSESSDDGDLKEKSVQQQKMEFSEVLEADGIWRSGPYFINFRKKEMETIVKLGARTSTDVSNFVLPKFEKSGSKFASFDVSSGIYNDSLKWSRKEKGKPVIKPRKRLISLAGEQFEVTSFCSPLCSSFKKYVDSLSKKVREELAGKTIKSVFENLKKIHPELTITPRSSECVQLLRHLHAARSSQKSFDESRRRFHSWKWNWRRVDLLRDVVKYGTQDEPADRELLAALAHTRWLMLSVESGNPHPESLVDLHEQFGRANICRAALASYDGMYFLFKWNQKEQKG
ncbi:hypothetical protein GCK72_008553 [Caenorhabditis remanei]|uniref:Uncharacterized protein n=1 Tax=Caenorhabditis remanei TaxID=31234 RepID=A0A6A5H0L0_CAERE|nr:hypothetical protein GCK72_008553 [Caenorhabditis remanei]KAF1760306.1 hypothetical protein GCK72_008553 [Caenorhabditis remanei]